MVLGSEKKVKNISNLEKIFKKVKNGSNLTIFEKKISVYVLLIAILVWYCLGRRSESNFWDSLCSVECCGGDCTCLQVTFLIFLLFSNKVLSFLKFIKRFSFPFSPVFKFLLFQNRPRSAQVFILSLLAVVQRLFL